MRVPIVTVAVCNGSEDTIEMLSAALTLRGYRAVGAVVTAIKRGRLNLEEFLARENPQVVVWDISLPYEENWLGFQSLRAQLVRGQRGVVLTTTHKANLDRLVATDTGAIEVVGKPYDINLICDAVQRALPGGSAVTSERTGVSID